MNLRLIINFRLIVHEERVYSNNDKPGRKMSLAVSTKREMKLTLDSKELGFEWRSGCVAAVRMATRPPEVRLLPSV